MTTDATGCAEPVIEGKTGFVVPRGNADALAAAMEKFVVQPERIAKMGAAARQHAETTFDVNKVNECLLSKMNLV